jgi:hypothetical protein
VHSLLISLNAALTTPLFKARFALLNDTALQCQGISSKINYEEDFNTDLQYLTSGRSENQQSVRCIFQVWNEYFFPSGFSGGGIPGTVPAQVIYNAFAALQEDGEENMEAPIIMTHVPVQSTHANPSLLPPTALHHQAPMMHLIPAMNGNLDSGMAASVWDRPPACIARTPSRRATPHALNLPEDSTGDVATGSSQTCLRT